MPSMSERYGEHRATLSRIEDHASAAQTAGEHAYVQTLATLAVAESLLLVAATIRTAAQE